MPTTREVEVARAERRRRNTRLYDIGKGTPRCTYCQGPMAIAGDRVHPTCTLEFRTIAPLSREAMRRA